MLYQPHEIEISQRYLQTVVSKLKEPVCMLGGWAVYITVGDSFRREHGRDYLGSRDIDLGFHIDKNWRRSELESSDFSLAIRTMHEMGFEYLSFRLVKHFHADTRRELKEEEAIKIPSYEMFDLFVDPVVDHIHPEAHEIFGFVPIDEPLLEQVFLHERCRTPELFGRKILLPFPAVLLATKLRSVQQRDREHKRVKDVTDIYALSWYSDEQLASLKKALAAIIPPQETRAIVDSFTREDLDSVSNVLDIETAQIRRVLDELKS
jgi:hypothetical protein